MNDRPQTINDEEIWDPNRFEIRTLQDEILSDQACQKLLRRFYLHQVDNGVEPEDAGALTRGADYFLRDFIVADRRENIWRIPPGRVRQFAGNWYIVKNLEPNPAELGVILTGVASFFDFAGRSAKVDPASTETLRKECSDFEFYCRRIEEFVAIEEDGYGEWRQGCPLED